MPRPYALHEMNDIGVGLRRGIEELGFPCTEAQIEDFLTYLEELKKWNRAYNLTAIKNDREIISRHFLDSLLFAKVLPKRATSVADIGSGAGFPGLPVKIVRPDLKVILVEPTQKKSLFLKHISARLGLSDIEVISSRIENIDGLRVDAAMTRALFSVRDFAAKAKGILNPGGVLILSKGPRASEELSGAEGLDVSVRDFTLPIENVVRHLIVIRPT